MLEVDYCYALQEVEKEDDLLEFVCPFEEERSRLSLITESRVCKHFCPRNQLTDNRT